MIFMPILTKIPRRVLANPRSLLFHTSVVQQKILNAKPFVISEKQKRIIRFREVPGQLQPTVVVIPGLHTYAHMSGMVAKCIYRYCDLNNLPCVMYDHECMGESAPDGDITKVLFSHWVEDTEKVIKELTEGPVLLVSLSMGGWLSMITTLKLPQRVHSMVLFAPAINYVHKYFQEQKEKLSEKTKEELDKGGIRLFTTSYGDALLKKDFAEDSLNHELDLTKRINISCPVRILHGLQDQEVDPDQSLKLANLIKSPDVDVIYRKSCKHQLVDIRDIECLLNTMDRLVKDYPIKSSSH